MVNSRDNHKYYIKQFVINEYDNPNVWTNQIFAEFCENNIVIGYLFSLKEKSKLIDDAQVLNLYLIKPEYYNGDKSNIVSLEELSLAYKLFLLKLSTENKNSKKNVFKNPPIKEWLDTKENWCKKLASKIEEKFGWSFGEALSEVYYIVMHCYTKPHVYMGNLGYIEKSVYNSVMNEYRRNAIRANGDNPAVYSLDEYVGENKDGDPVALIELVADEDYQAKNRNYEELEKFIKHKMRFDFSERELEQIINQKPSYLPNQLYTKLLRWRAKNKMEEVLGDYYEK